MDVTFCSLSFQSSYKLMVMGILSFEETIIHFLSRTFKARLQCNINTIYKFNIFLSNLSADFF